MPLGGCKATPDRALRFLILSAVNQSERVPSESFSNPKIDVVAHCLARIREEVEQLAETARQLIDHAKYMSRRKFPGQEKIRVVLGGICAEESVAICVVARRSIRRSTTSG